VTKKREKKSEASSLAADLSARHNLPPWITDPGDWVNTKEFAIRWNRSESTVRMWCRDGTAVEFGLTIYRDPKGRWWLKVPPGL
jgi:hypothetical protein